MKRDDGGRALLERVFTYCSLLLFAGTAFIIPTSLLPGREKARVLGERMAALEAELTRTLDEGEALLREHRALQDDPYYIERVLRRDYRMMGPGPELAFPVEPGR